MTRKAYLLSSSLMYGTCLDNLARRNTWSHMGGIRQVVLTATRAVKRKGDKGSPAEI